MTATTTLAACPAWCGAGDQHGYEGTHVATGRLTRGHVLDIGAVWIAQDEYVNADGTIELGPVVISVSQDVVEEEIDGPRAKQIAADLLAASDRWYQIKEGGRLPGHNHP